jgi:hypothetical protein
MKKQLLTALFVLFTTWISYTQWTIFDAPNGGTILDLCTDGHSIFALSRSLIYESQNQGETWGQLPVTTNDGQQFKRIEAGNGIIYAIDQDNALFKSADRGATWSNIFGPTFPQQYQGQKMNGLLVLGDTVLAVTQYAMYRTVNQGVNWELVGDFFNEEVNHFFEYNNEIFAWGGPAVFRSSDRGLTWKKVFFTIFPFKLASATKRGIYLLYNDQKTIVHSTDGLRTWTTKTSNLSSSADIHKGFFANETTLKIIQTEEFFVDRDCYSPIHSSLDDGLTWTTIFSNFPTVPLSGLYNILELPGGRILLCGKDGVKYSDDVLETFHWANNGIKETSLTAFSTRKGTVMTNYGMAHQLNLQTGQWEALDIGYTDNDCLANVAYFGTEKRLYHFKFDYQFINEGVLYSDNEGAQWDTLHTLSGFEQSVTTSSGSLWATYNNKHLRINDETTEIEEKKLDISQFNNDWGGYPQARNNELWLVTAKRAFSVFSDEGTLIKYFPLIESCPLASIFTIKYFYDGQRAWGICGDETYVYHRDSSRWNEVHPVDWTNGVPLYHYGIRMMETFNGAMLFATDKGIFVNNGKDNRCYPISPTFPLSNQVVSMRVAGDTLWVATNRPSKILMLKLNGEQWVGGSTPQFTAKPNPSTGALEITSDVFVGEALQMEILDAAGRRIRTLPIAGGNQWNFELNDLASGVYILHFYGSGGINSLKWVKQ